MAGLEAQLQDARRDEAAASATRDILAEQLHAATDAMAEQVRAPCALHGISVWSWLLLAEVSHAWKALRQ